MNDDLITFRRMYADAPDAEEYHKAAVDKLQTLYPGKQITTYDLLTIGIQTDSLYSDTGIDTYELGLIDGETPALRNIRSEELITFRL